MRSVRGGVQNQTKFAGEGAGGGWVSVRVGRSGLRAADGRPGPRTAAEPYSTHGPASSFSATGAVVIVVTRHRRRPADTHSPWPSVADTPSYGPRARLDRIQCVVDNRCVRPVNKNCGFRRQCRPGRVCAVSSPNIIIVGFFSVPKVLPAQYLVLVHPTAHIDRDCYTWIIFLQNFFFFFPSSSPP